LQKVLITGTDTDVGKTHFSATWLRQLAAQNRRCVGLKPIASGCVQASAGVLQSEDALALMAASSQKLSYVQSNPFAFAPPIAPHLAARAAATLITLAQLRPSWHAACAVSDFVLMEGAGGWLSPLADGLEHADLAREFDLPVLLVVGIRLGCINHARLSCQAILHSGVRLAGWVASVLPIHMQAREETIETLQAFLPEPLLARIEGNVLQDFGLLAQFS
jgi:dethiobiotin synthetase